MDMLVVFIPTILFVLIVLYQMIRGFMRGQRKSIYLLINMAIAMVISLILFLSWTNIGGIELINESFPELEDQLTGAVEFIIGDKTLDVTLAYISLIVNLVVLIVIQLFVYPMVKAILYIIYLFAFRSKVVEDKEDGNSRRIGGMLIGGLRGLIVGFLVFSQFSTLYYIVAGGVFYSSDEYDTLDMPFEKLGLDEASTEMIDSIYKGIKTYRSTGLGAGFEKLSIGGQSLDYIFLDFVISGSYENFKGDKTKVTLREELGNTIGVFAILLETGSVKFEGGKLLPDISKLDEEVLNKLADKLSKTNLFVDGIPTVLIDFIENNEEVLGMKIDTELLKNLDLEKDIKEVAVILSSFISMIDFENYTDFSSIDFYNLDADTVDSIIDSLSKITFVVDVMLPLGVNFISATVEELVFDLDGIIWNEELQNLKGLYGTLQDLGLKDGFDGLFTTLEKALSENNTEVINQLDDVVTQVFSSDLVYRLSTGVMEMVITDLTTGDDGLSDLEIDMSKYTKDLFRADVDILVNNVVGGYSLYKQITSEGFLEENFIEFDINGLREMLLGKEKDDNNEKTLGIMDLNIITKCTDEDKFYYSLFSVAADGILELPEGLVWRDEVGAMCDVLTTIQTSEIDLSALMSGDLTALAAITPENSTKLTNAICDSVLITTFFVTSLTGEDSPLGAILEIPEGINWYGEDGEIKSLLTSIFCIVGKEDALQGLLEGDFTSVLSHLTEDDVDVLLASEVLTATLSVQLIALGDGILNIPADLIDGNGYIESAELHSLLTVLISIDLDFENLDMNIFFGDNVEYDVIFASKIITATVSTMLIDLNVLEIPDSAIENGNITNVELISLMNSLRTLNLDFDNMDMNAFFAAGVKYEDVFSSSIILATVSTMLIDLDVFTIPSSVRDGEYILQSELVNLMSALRSLNLNFDNITIDSFLNADTEILFSSEILRATVSESLTSSELRVNPSVIDENGYITQVELTNLFEGFKSLEITSLDNMDFAAILMNTNSFSIALNSVILHETLSDTLTSVIAVPVTYHKNAEEVINVVVEGIIIKDEITNYINSIKILNLTDVDSAIDVNMVSNLSDSQIETLTSSYIMCSLVSEFNFIQDIPTITKVNVTTTKGTTILIAYSDVIAATLGNLN